MLKRGLIMTATIQVRIDEELKNKSDALFKELGTDLTSAIRMFLTQAVANNGFPFEIKKKETMNVRRLTEEELLMRLEIAREQETRGEVYGAKSVVEAMKSKYGV